ncbi:MAG: shikimate dehydrogenase [Ruminococcaceae bacterium]|nr:shikimate dehydrogenase [Oscillospiraceae bacterium]
MEYGCIGEKLGHSFSKEIHNALTDYNYELKEIAKENVDAFMRERDFKAINVTIPYKETVIPYLDSVSDEAKKIGAVNTIVNKNGVLYGYNTDFYGMKSLIERAEIELENKTVAILGGGGTSKTAYAVAESSGAKAIYKVSRSSKDGFITYDELYNISDSIDIIINTTPVGMYPNIYASAVEIEKFKNLSGVVDAVYNPLRSKLVFDASENNIKAVGGLYMLVAQAAAAVEKFIDTEVKTEKIERVFKGLFNNKENIVLIGMPASGKTTIGTELSAILNRPFYDSDRLIEETENCTIPEIFKNKGEAYFRECEADAIFTLSKNNSSVISTGGGAVLNKKNIELLKENGKIFFLDRPLEMLVTTNDRPLSSNRADLEKRYNERYELYKTYADVLLDASGSIEDVVNQILKVLE